MTFYTFELRTPTGRIRPVTVQTSKGQDRARELVVEAHQCDFDDVLSLLKIEDR